MRSGTVLLFAAAAIAMAAPTALLATGGCSLEGLAAGPTSSSSSASTSSSSFSSTSSSASASSGAGGSPDATSGTGGAPLMTDPPTFYEAEDADLKGGFVIGDDPDASAGKVVYVPSTVDCQQGATDSRVIFSVEVDAGGEYVVLARALADSGGHDSFYVDLDNGSDTFFGVHADGTFQEKLVKDALTGVLARYALKPGKHILIFKCRENEAWLDRVGLERVVP